MREEEQSYEVEQRMLSCPFCHTRDRMYNYIRVGGGKLECKECHTIFDGDINLFPEEFPLAWVEHD